MGVARRSFEFGKEFGYKCNIAIVQFLPFYSSGAKVPRVFPRGCLIYSYNPYQSHVRLNRPLDHWHKLDHRSKLQTNPGVSYSIYL